MTRRAMRLIAMALVPGGFGSAAVFAQRGPAGVAVSPVVERSVSAGQTLIGTIEPARRAVIGSAVDGRVVSFPVNEGDWVPKNGVLAQLLTQTLQHELAGAKATLLFRQAELKELKAGTRPEEIQQALARMEQAKVLKTQAETAFARIEKLYKDGVETRDRFDLAQFTRSRSEQAFQEARLAWELARLGPRMEKKEQARARVAEQQAILDRLVDQIEKHTIISRFAGYVVAEYTEVGQWVKRGDPIAEVIDLNFVELRVHVLESQLPHIRRGMSVRVEVPALSRSVLARLPRGALLGRIERIIRGGNARTRTFPVKIRVKNPANPLASRPQSDTAPGQPLKTRKFPTRSGESKHNGAGGGLLKQNPAGSSQPDSSEPPVAPLLGAGMLARAALPTGSPVKALLVPKDALVLGGKTPIVFVAEAKAGKPGTARPVSVELGVADGTLLQVTGKIKKGELVIVRGNERLQPGQSIVITQTLPPEFVPTTKSFER